MDSKAKRRLLLRHKTNEELFGLYEAELHVKLTPDQFDQYNRLLGLFHKFLGDFPPTPELAAKFLSRYADRKPATMVRYTGIIRGFMEWYGEDFDLKPRKPKNLPQYVNPEDIKKLIQVVGDKCTHKASAERDILLIRFACFTGLRRGELSRLVIRDVNLSQGTVFVRNGKGYKDRSVPLPKWLIPELEEFLTGKKPDESIFSLTARSITDKLAVWSKKAGVNLHPHSLRHSYAEQLLEIGTPLPVVQGLLGHQNLQTTAVYLGLRPEAFREAVDKLEAELKPDSKYFKLRVIKDHEGNATSIQITGSIPMEKIAEKAVNSFFDNVQFITDEESDF